MSRSWFELVFCQLVQNFKSSVTKQTIYICSVFLSSPIVFICGTGCGVKVIKLSKFPPFTICPFLSTLKKERKKEKQAVNKH